MMWCRVLSNLCSPKTHRGANLSESEAEQDGDHNITELPQVYSGRGNMATQQSAVRLTEVSVQRECNIKKIIIYLIDTETRILLSSDRSSHDSATDEDPRRHGRGEYHLSLY